MKDYIAISPLMSPYVAQVIVIPKNNKEIDLLELEWD